MAVFIVGVTLVKGYETERDVKMNVGDTVSVGGYTFRFDGVTDARGRCHAVPNLLVADGSLFPTVGAVNPASTIGALALKLADDLARDLA